MSPASPAVPFLSDRDLSNDEGISCLPLEEVEDVVRAGYYIGRTLVKIAALAPK